MMNAACQLSFADNVLSVSGDLDFETVMPMLKQSASLLPKQQPVQVDLSGLSVIDSGGLALLCQWKRDYPELRLIHMPQQFDSIIHISGLGDVLFQHG